jgi:hypothetical protein
MCVPKVPALSSASRARHFSAPAAIMALKIDRSEDRNHPGDHHHHCQTTWWFDKLELNMRLTLKRSKNSRRRLCQQQRSREEGDPPFFQHQDDQQAVTTASSSITTTTSLLWLPTYRNTSALTCWTNSSQQDRDVQWCTVSSMSESTSSRSSTSTTTPQTTLPPSSCESEQPVHQILVFDPWDKVDHRPPPLLPPSTATLEGGGGQFCTTIRRSSRPPSPRRELLFLCLSLLLSFALKPVEAKSKFILII